MTQQYPEVVWLIQDSGFDFEHVERLIKALDALGFDHIEIAESFIELMDDSYFCQWAREQNAK